MAIQLELFRSVRWSRVHTFANRIWKNRWTGRVMIATGFIWWAWWRFHLPLPAEAATVLGFIAAIMVFRGEVGGLEKFFWTVLLFAYVLVEIKAIEHKDQVDECLRKAAEKEQTAEFQGIATGITDAINKSDKQFQVTASGLNAAITASTQAVTNTHPRAVIVLKSIDPVVEPSSLSPKQVIFLTFIGRFLAQKPQRTWYLAGIHMWHSLMMSQPRPKLGKNLTNGGRLQNIPSIQASSLTSPHYIRSTLRN